MKVLIIGDIMLDHYLFGECSRISPEAPVPVVSIKKEEWRLGGAANVANNLVALNANCALIGISGKDYVAQFGLLLGNNALIKSNLHKSGNRSTIVKSRVLVGGHQMIRLDRETLIPLSEQEENALLKSFYKEINDTDIVLLSDYNKGMLSENVLKAVFKASKALNIPTIVDPKSADFSKYSGTYFIKPNKREAEQATGIEIKDKLSLERASQKITELTGAKTVMTTLSEQGVALYNNGYLQVIPTRARKVFDVTGAGDTYLAAFAYEYVNTKEIISACEFANFAAAVVVAKIGSSTATLEEINQIKAELCVTAGL